ncbi:TPA: hypothetical protein SH331_000496 [Pseudomonas aeruginosa]|uniref:hypothetical protein n=1 Tax=Pseudomonas aeruginosa TaxID=287 RepID=UPI000940DE21|nr:hypothetical protein [Pseudomonas aeruginosa]QVJ05536.1 hypothetical protein KGZ78_29385 [Pseudomonas aeruginosa]QVJ05605.1 hypothetical protein KGZ78_00290 [Pseudomonas aeruginosa]QYA82755.1 hypothetical protein KXE03_11555 [Pseudomonas aeruginosa]RQD01259.1 hypothetical protein IPC345_03100 [Pseudomonas aeruginosa]HBN9925256.1 hypothetical protein [Pseudomonas aeruginosa]
MHATFTYHLNQITEGRDNFRDHAVSVLYNVVSVLRWQLKDHTLHRSVTRNVSQQGRLTTVGRWQS